MKDSLRGPVVAALASLCLATAAPASDEKAFAELKARYETAAKKHDDNGIRERRKLLLQFFDYLDQKACRKLLREAFDSEDAADTRISAVQVLGATGDPKDLDVIVKGLAKERLRGPAIALGEGLSYTGAEGAAAVSVHAVLLAAKAKGDLRFSLLEGVAELGDPAGYEPLAALREKLLPEEQFIRDVALGACGREKAVADLALRVKAAGPVVSLGAVLGLARTGAKESLAPLTDALRALEPRVVEAAAAALGAAKHRPAADAMVDAMATAPLRVRYALRAALAEIVAKDVGLDAGAWRAALAGGKPEPAAVPATEPKLPAFFGIPVASDRVVVLLDLSHSMGWMDRLARSQNAIAAFLESIDDAVSFNVYTCAKTAERFAKSPCMGAASRGQAVAWVRKQLGGSGFDLKAALLRILEESPETDTVLLATDSLPWGEGAAETCMEAMEIFRRANTTRRVRLHAAFVVPGGRVTTTELEPEFEDRAVMLERMAKASGGTFVRIDK